MILRGLLLIFLVLLGAIQRGNCSEKETTSQFNIKMWESRYGKKLSVNDWRKKNPMPWSQYFAKDNPKCAETWYVMLGPLGIRTLMHDKFNEKFSAFKNIFPKVVSNSDGSLKYNCCEVLEVDADGPTHGKILAGDLILKIDGQSLKSATEMFPDKEVLAKETRTLELHVAKLIDAAEGRGRISFTVLRLNESERNQTISDSKFKSSLKKITIRIPQIGSFGDSFNPKSAKVKNYSRILAKRLATQQAEDGSWQAGGTYSGPTFHSSMCGLALLSTGDKSYSPHIKRAAHYVAYSGAMSDWSYPNGVNCLFLAEYYLRYKDKSILRGLKTALKRASDFVQSDYTAGHKHHPGYRGCGWIGGGGGIAAAFAVASHTPVRSHNSLLDKMLIRAQEISPQGVVPYGRERGRTEFTGEPSKGQAWSAGTGPYYLATMIRGGADYFRRVVTKKYGTGPWGDADGGHATHILQFFWGSLASSMTGPRGLKGNMDAFLWKFTNYRNFDGFINANTNRLEYHGAQGIMGYPYWRTAAHLILINSYKRYLAITGHPKYRAKKFRNAPIVYFYDKGLWSSTIRNWQMVQAALGKKSPKSIAAGIAHLKKFPMDANLSAAVFNFLNLHAPTVARQISQLQGVKKLTKSHCMELILGSGVEFSAKTNKGESSSATVELALNVSTAYERWRKALAKDQQSKNPVKTLQINGTVTVTDPQKKLFSEPLVFKISPTKMRFKQSIPVIGEKDYQLVAKIEYSSAGLKFNYSMPVMVNSTHPMAPYYNTTKIWVPGYMAESNISHKFPIKLPNGQLLSATKREGNDIRVHREEEIVNAGTTFHLVAGSPCYFLMTAGTIWEPTVLEVKLRKNHFGILKPADIIVNHADVHGDLKQICDFNQKTAATLVANSDSNPMSIDFVFNKPVTLASMAYYTHNSGHAYQLELVTNGKAIPFWWGSLFTNRYIHIMDKVKGKHFRLVFKGKKGTRVNIKELHLHQAP